MYSQIEYLTNYVSDAHHTYTTQGTVYHAHAQTIFYIIEACNLKIRHDNIQVW